MNTFSMDGLNLPGMAAAVGIGLLIGIERERRKSGGPDRAPAGIRTFTLTSLLGALSLSVGGELTLVTVGAFVGLLAVVGYLRSRSDDPGLTTEVALITTFMLGALAVRNTAVAAALGVLVTIVLASRSKLHHFVRQIITDQELHDGLLLAAAALVILPLIPNRTVDPLGVLNPRILWTLAVLVMAINAAGYVVLRMAGPRFGLSFAGFASGFISSTATIASMGAREAGTPELRRGAVSGAVLSSVSTVINLAIVIGATSLAVLKAVTLPLVCAGFVAVAYGGFFAWRSVQQPAAPHVPPGRAFDPRIAIIFTLTIAAVLMVSALLARWLGSGGLLAAAAVSGLADTHAAAVAVAAIAAGGQLAPADAVVPILLAFTTNTLTKCVVAVATGERRFALQVIPGVVLMTLAAWAGFLIAAL